MPRAYREDLRSVLFSELYGILRKIDRCLEEVEALEKKRNEEKIEKDGRQTGAPWFGVLDKDNVLKISFWAKNLLTMEKLLLTMEKTPKNKKIKNSRALEKSFVFNCDP